MRWAMRLIQRAYGKVIFFQVSIANRGWRLLFWEWPRREKHVLVLFVRFLFNPCWCLLVRFFHLTIARQCCGNIHYCPIPEKKCLGTIPHYDVNLLVAIGQLKLMEWSWHHPLWKLTPKNCSSSPCQLLRFTTSSFGCGITLHLRWSLRW